VAVTDKDLDNDLGDIAVRIEKLRVKYQGYFLGLEKLPPLFERDQFEKFLRVTPLNDARRAVHKFRFQALQQRYRTLAVHWDRIMRELDEGKTTREAMRRDAGYASSAVGERAREVLMVPADGEEAALAPLRIGRKVPGGAHPPAAAGSHAAPGAPGSPASPASPAPAPAAPPADDSLKRLYVDYITARSSLGLASEGITEAAFRASLDKQRKAQAEKLGAPDVSFSVVVKEGRVVLMARPATDPAKPT